MATESIKALKNSIKNRLNIIPAWNLKWMRLESKCKKNLLDNDVINKEECLIAKYHVEEAVNKALLSLHNNKGGNSDLLSMKNRPISKGTTGKMWLYLGRVTK